MDLPSPSRMLECVATLEGYNGKIQHLTGARRAAIKAMKAGGINTQSVLELIKMKTADPLEYREYLEHLGVGLRATGQPYQINIFDTNYGNPEAQARAEARAQANGGRAPECRWPENSSPHAAFMDEYSGVIAKLVPGADKLTAAEMEKAIREGNEAADAT
jgi:hypothetical protein